MKILAASDVHGNYAVYEWLVRIDKEVDLMVLAGDLLGYPEGFDSVEAAQRADAETIKSILRAATCPIYFIMGNDDLVELDPSPNRIESLHGRRFELGRWNFVGYQYSLPFMGGVYEKPETDIRDDLIRLANKVDKETILVTHSPAYGVLDVGVLNAHAGSHAILDLARNHDVRAHVHGHIHGEFGRSGRHFNVASGGRHQAMVIDLKSMRARVVKG